MNLQASLEKKPLEKKLSVPGANFPGSDRLVEENRRFAGTGGVSTANRSLGFQPAFRDTTSGRVYPSCFADGRPAPFHLFDGLPHTLCVVCNFTGRVLGIRPEVVSGFCREGRFYTREQVAALVPAG